MKNATFDLSTKKKLEKIMQKPECKDYLSNEVSFLMNNYLKMFKSTLVFLE